MDQPPGKRLTQIEGMVPGPFNRPPGCPFQTRCPDRKADPCATACPDLFDTATSIARCYQYDPRYAALWQGQLAQAAAK
jgi:peptide/nickel transport system ATP-binding protein